MSSETPYETNSQRKQRLKSENLWILQWCCRIALLFSVLIFLDFLLPANESKERIVDSWYSRAGRLPSNSMRIKIESGQKFSIYPNQSTEFRELNKDGNILVQISPIFGMVLNVVNEDHSIVVPVSILHTYLAVVPALMFFISLAGVIANRDVDWVFNLGATCIIFVVVNICLIFLAFK
jgi:hypothetical protein